MTHIDLAQVTWLRNELRSAADKLPKRTVGTPPLGGASGPAFGNATSSVECAETWRETMAETQAAFEYLRFSLAADVGRLDSVMATFARMDAEAADDIAAAAMRSTTLDVYNTHIASGTGKEADQNRSDQLDRSVDHIQAGGGGPAIFAGDMNTTNPPQVDRLQGEGWADASADRDGNPIGSHHGNPIDKVYTGPGVAVTGAGRPIDGGPSDHDGVVVDVGVAPAWP